MPTKKTTVNSALIRVEEIEQRIYFIRGQRVMLDKDLAELYQVETFNLNKAVKRNINRFPDDFMFTLSQEEAIGLKFQIGMSKRKGSGGRRYLPNVFTQEGVAMLSSILRSERAVQVNVLIMRAFVRLRELMISNKELAAKLDTLERKYDGQFRIVFQAIRKLMDPPNKSQSRRIGF